MMNQQQHTYSSHPHAHSYVRTATTTLTLPIKMCVFTSTIGDDAVFARQLNHMPGARDTLHNSVNYPHFLARIEPFTQAIQSVAKDPRPHPLADTTPYINPCKSMKIPSIHANAVPLCILWLRFDVTNGTNSTAAHNHV